MRAPSAGPDRRETPSPSATRSTSPAPRPVGPRLDRRSCRWHRHRDRPDHHQRHHRQRRPLRHHRRHARRPRRGDFLGSCHCSRRRRHLQRWRQLRCLDRRSGHHPLGSHQRHQHLGRAWTSEPTLAATLDLNGFNQQLAGLTRTSANTATVTNSGAPAALTINTTGTSAYPGDVSGALSLVKSGSGSQTLSGAVSYSRRHHRFRRHSLARRRQCGQRSLHRQHRRHRSHPGPDIRRHRYRRQAVHRRRPTDPRRL